MTSNLRQSDAKAESPDEVLEFAAALCDDSLDAEQGRRLAYLLSVSDDARRRFVEYLFLHGELHWAGVFSLPSGVEAAEAVTQFVDAAIGARVAASARLASPMAEDGPCSFGGDRSRRRLGIRAVFGALSLVAAIVLVAVALWRTRPPGELVPEPPAVRLVGTFAAVWDGDTPPDVGEVGKPGRWWTLTSGLAQWEMPSGATFIVEGPARWACNGSNGVRLLYGTLSAEVPEAARGFCVETEGVRVVDEGTSFGVCVEPDGRSEVHVFAGRVAVVAAGAERPSLALSEGQSLAWLPSQRNLLAQLAPAPASEDRFVRSMPPARCGSVAQLRRAMAEHPRLIHLFSFEAVDPAMALRDAKGDLHLHCIIMSGGDGGGSLRMGVRGRDATTRAARFYRAMRDGNRVGVGLVSERPFAPPKNMTIELLARFDAQPRADGGIYSAVATRRSRKQCGFFVAAVDDGRLAHLFDADSPWIVPPGEPFWRPLIGTIGDWHYLCVRLEQETEHTRVSTFAANLTHGDRTLRCLIDSVRMAGHAASGPLAVGCGFDEDLTHAYPWAGVIDELAIYDAALPTETLQQHLDLLWSAHTDVAEQSGRRR